MGKIETVAKYINDFLKDKSPEAADKFRAKGVDKQYSAIMAWRRKLRQEAQTPESAEAIVDYIKQACVLISNAAELSADELARITLQIDQLREYLDEYKESQRMRKISELERRQEEIARQLRELRGEEPNLFNSL